MKLSLGMRVIETQTLNRFQVVDFDATTVRLRPLEYRPSSLVPGGPMVWVVPEKAHIVPPRDVLFTGAGDKP